MRTDCERHRRLAVRDLAGDVDLREFEELDRHRDDCAACGAWQGTANPLGLFRVLADEPAGPERQAGLWDGIRGGVQEAGRMGLREAFGLLRPGIRVALAAGLVAAAGLAALLPGAGGPPAAPAPLPALSSAVSAGPPARATVESIRSPGARIYEMKIVGEGDQVAQLVMILDEEIDL